jgi:hypothetical protein
MMRTGPNIYGISNKVPDNCYVEQVSYNVRHGSRYPDSGAYSQWTTLYAKVEYFLDATWANETSINADDG